jgi:homoserine dehydrogenase
MTQGKHIVTANKALLAERFDRIFSMADEKKVNMGFEASVAGGIPIIKILQESFMTNKIRKIFGILNGTTNYILTKMTQEDLSFDLALKQAQEKGFAEADPTLDVDGIDAAHKALILANLAFGMMLDFKSVMVRGIRNFNVMDIAYARQLGYTIKLLAVCKRRKDNSMEIYVEPALIPNNHLLASVQNEFNAVYVDGEAVGETVFYGRGAGAMPTANSVISDIIDMSRDISTNHKVWYTKYMAKASEKTNQNIRNKYYLRISTHDKPGVLGKVAGILGENNISISSCVQKETGETTIPLVLTTHKCLKDDIDKAVLEIQKLKEIKDKVVVLNIQ